MWIVVVVYVIKTLYVHEQSVDRKENEAKREQQTKQEAPRQQETKTEETAQQELTELEQIQQEQLMEWSSEGESDGTTRMCSFVWLFYLLKTPYLKLWNATDDIPEM